jgi:hypothetical protein
MFRTGATNRKQYGYKCALRGPGADAEEHALLLAEQTTIILEGLLGRRMRPWTGLRLDERANRQT